MQTRPALYTATTALCATLTLLGFAPTLHAQNTQPAPTSNSSETHLALTFSGGHDTDPRDGGRPVNLVAGGLGVPPEVFRQAFSHVHPAGVDSGGPTPNEARANKAALMNVLAKYGITNEKLDEVSNYYRYVRSHGQMWPTQPAAGYAVVANGKITRFVITASGSGYTVPPTVTIPGMPNITATAKITFSTKSGSQNGAVSTVTLAQPDGTPH